ncbi:MAG TPA: hypothetical protein VMF90_06970 [Rhizobiaceae bacterium]|nr:hypothetical protein [Rhizobiaceae bacterium]
MFHFSRSHSSAIRFLCSAEDDGVIAPPVPAKSVLPEWFRKLPAVDRSAESVTNNGLTVKRCMPFLDAMMTGYLLPIAATVRLDIRDGGRTVETGWEFDKKMVSNHGPHQVAGNPKEPAPPCKFHNYWSIRTAPGWSCLFVPPLNRPAQPFECVAGIVDTDAYSAHIHFPFFAAAPDGVYTVERGTPLVQIIPFYRDEAKADIRAETTTEFAEREKIYRKTLAGDGWYRKEARAQR